MLVKPLSNRTLALYILNLSLIAEIFFSYFRVGPLPLRVYFLLIFTCVGVLASSLNAEPLRFRIHSPVKYLLFFFAIAIALQLGELNSPKFWHYISRGMGASFLIYVLTTYALRNNRRAMHSAILTLSLAVGLSCVFAILQALGIDTAWSIRQLAPIALENEMSEALSLQSRPVGLSYTPIELGYQISVAFPLCWYLMTTQYGERKVALKALLAILFLGAIACQTRSALVANLVSIILLSKFSGGRKYLTFKNIIYTALLLGVTALISLTFGIAERLFQMDESALGKVFLMYAGVLYIGSNPIGSGILMKDFFAFKSGLLGMWADYSGGILAQVERYTPHNQFINTGVIFGITGLLALILFYTSILTRLKRVPLESGDRPLAYAIYASIIAYIINSVVHNAGPFVGDPFAWYFIGMAGALTNASFNKKIPPPSTSNKPGTNTDDSKRIDGTNPMK